MKRIAFITWIQDGSYRYHKDLEGLYLICAEYKYKIFGNLDKIIRLYIDNLLVQIYNLCFYLSMKL